MKNKILFLVAGFLLFSLFGMGITYAQEEKTLPADVSGVEIKTGDKEATLKWKPSIDDDEIDHYNVYYDFLSVIDLDGNHAHVVEVDGEDNFVTVDGLINNRTYFFVVTAVDLADDESENYSLEVSAMPREEKKAELGLQLVSAEAIYDTEVVLSFSRSVILPEHPEIFFLIREVLEDYQRGEILPIKEAYLSIGDEGERVVLETDWQISDQEYVVIAGVGITDFTGNPVKSGVTDSAYFLGTDVEKPVPLTGGEVLQVEAFGEEEPQKEEEFQKETIRGVASSSPPGYLSHTVKKYESLTKIAESFGLTALDLAIANGIRKYDGWYVIRVDDEILIPLQGPLTQAEKQRQREEEQDHTLVMGQSLTDVARQYGISVKDLADYNGIKKVDGWYRIKVGDGIKIPSYREVLPSLPKTGANMVNGG